jgi:hypothetical protein
MAITTLDGVIAGMQSPKPFYKAGITMAAVAAQRGYTHWYRNGNPGAAVANAAGVNGAAVTGNSVAGQIPRSDPGSGNAHLARLQLSSSATGTLWLIDRLWNNSGLSVTSTTAQAITPATLPARDSAGSTNGANVLAAIEWSATGGAGTPTVTLTYTNQDGNTGATGTFTGVSAPPVGTFEIFTLASGDNGVRAPTSFIQSATRTSGTMHLVLFRVLATMEVPLASVGSAIDALTGGMPRLFNGTVPQFVWFPTATTAVNLYGSYVETQG